MINAGWVEHDDPCLKATPLLWLIRTLQERGGRLNSLEAREALRDRGYTEDAINEALLGLRDRSDLVDYHHRRGLFRLRAVVTAMEALLLRGGRLPIAELRELLIPEEIKCFSVADMVEMLTLYDITSYVNGPDGPFLELDRP